MRSRLQRQPTIWQNRCSACRSCFWSCWQDWSWLGLMFCLIRSIRLRLMLPETPMFSPASSGSILLYIQAIYFLQRCCCYGHYSLIEPLYVRWMAKGQADKSKNKYGIDLICAACPPLRMGKSIPARSGQIWLPRMGWRTPGKTLHKELERAFSKPMLVVALLILPVLLIEFRYQELLQETLWLKLLLSISMGLIWCAFTCEFIVMVSSTRKKLAYVKKNWIDSGDHPAAVDLIPEIPAGGPCGESWLDLQRFSN